MRTSFTRHRAGVAARLGDQRIEIIANGFGVARSLQSTSLWSLRLTPTQGRAATAAALLSQPFRPLTRPRKERTCPELQRLPRCRLVVLALEAAGRWSPEAAHFVPLLAGCKACAVPLATRKHASCPLVAAACDFCRVWSMSTGSVTSFADARHVACPPNSCLARTWASLHWDHRTLGEKQKQIYRSSESN